MTAPTCAHCGEPLPIKTGPGRKQKYCDQTCVNRAFNARQVLKGQRCAMSVRECPYCEDLYVARVGPNRPSAHCGKLACKRLDKNAQQRSWSQAFQAKHGVTYSHLHHSDQRHIAKLRREGKLVDGWEHFRREDVYERDGWVCQLCGKPVDPALKWPHPGSRSLDHKVPVSQGGKHTKDNAQLAHLGCNCSKQAS